jgi:hypothetical protein
MAMLYYLHLSLHVRGMVKGPVISTQGPISLEPDNASVLQCLPSCYRKAFRAAGNMWWRNAHEGPGENLRWLRLYSSRGKYLNTIHAVGKDFN